jgi:hypothetical protein
MFFGANAAGMNNTNSDDDLRLPAISSNNRLF